MDLGIAGRTAIICASTRGLGRACAEALAAEGVDIVVNGRNPGTLDAAVTELIARFDVKVSGVLGDIGHADTRDALIAACPEADILVTNNDGPAPASFASWGHGDWVEALESNMVAALMLIQGVVEGMSARHFGRIVNITSAMVTSPQPAMALSSGARAGLTAAVKALSRSVARHNVTINNLLPERFDTDRQIAMAHAVAQHDSVTYEAARARQVESIAARRLGRPEEFGAACAFLCGTNAGYISGNNLHLDGGSYPGLI